MTLPLPSCLIALQQPPINLFTAPLFRAAVFHCFTLLTSAEHSQMAAPPIPPRPFDNYDDYVRRPESSESPPPAIPPLPVGFKLEQEDTTSAFSSAPHFEDPLVAPRPQKLQPNLPAHVSDIPCLLFPIAKDLACFAVKGKVSSTGTSWHI